jgi:hypothetical protein
MTRGVPWGPGDLAGGPVDQIFSALRQAFRELRIERLSVVHPADDNNVWFIAQVNGDIEVQLDSMPNGYPPYLLESDHAQERTEEVGVAIETLSSWLRE